MTQFNADRPADLTGYIASEATITQAMFICGVPNFAVGGCPICGKDWATCSFPDQTYCSMECYAFAGKKEKGVPSSWIAFVRRKPKGYRKPLGHCATCGRPVYTPNVKYCMWRCRPRSVDILRG